MVLLLLRCGDVAADVQRRLDGAARGVWVRAVGDYADDARHGASGRTANIELKRIGGDLAANRLGLKKLDREFGVSDTDEMLRDYRAASGPYRVQMPTGEYLYVGMERDVSAVDGGDASQDEVLQSVRNGIADFGRGDWVDALEASRMIRERYGM